MPERLVLLYLLDLVLGFGYDGWQRLGCGQCVVVLCVVALRGWRSRSEPGGACAAGSSCARRGLAPATRPDRPISPGEM